MAGLSPRDESMEIGYLRGPLLFHVMRSWTAPWGVVPGVPFGEEAPRQAQDTLVGLHFSSCSGTPVCYPIASGGKKWGEDDLGFPAECFLCDPDLDKWR